MKIIAAIAAACALLVPAVPAGAQAAHHFRNCTAMHHTYKGGVARKGAHDHRAHGGHARYRPYVNTTLYKANAGLDRDHDGIACEQ